MKGILPKLSGSGKGRQKASLKVTFYIIDNEGKNYILKTNARSFTGSKRRNHEYD
jgi:hypothetical protein